MEPTIAFSRVAICSTLVPINLNQRVEEKQAYCTILRFHLAEHIVMIRKYLLQLAIEHLGYGVTLRTRTRPYTTKSSERDTMATNEKSDAAEA